MLVDDLDNVLVGVGGLTFISIGLKSSLEGFNCVVAPCLMNIEFWFRCVNVVLVLGGVGGRVLFCISRVFGLGICNHLALQLFEILHMCRISSLLVIEIIRTLLLAMMFLLREARLCYTLCLYQLSPLG